MSDRSHRPGTGGRTARSFACVPHRLGLALGLVLAWTGAPGSASGQSSSQCSAWPGEISPLPTSESPDPLAARWAELRASELSRLAAALQESNPSAAHRLSRHALCLDPRSDALERQLAQLAPASGSIAAPPRAVRAPEPDLPGVATAPTETPEAPRPAPSRPSAPAPDLGPVDASLDAVSAALFEARFRDALGSAREARSLLADLGEIDPARIRRARLEVMTTTAQLALGREPEATESLRRALAADPDLELDASTPPKVRRLLESIRSLEGSP